MSRWPSKSLRLAGRGRVAVLAGAIAVLASAIAATPSLAQQINVEGELIPGGILVDPSGQPAIAGTNNSCGASVLTGCLVQATASATSDGPPLVVNDGFQTQIPTPTAWAGLEQSAEATVASLRGVPADKRNQNWSRAEINALVFLDLIGLIKKQADGETLTAQETAALDLLRTSYQDHEKEVTDLALDLYNTWAASPCTFQVPVGKDPGAYARKFAGLCSTPVGGLLTTPPPPTAEQFTEWARELVEEDFRRSLVQQLLHFGQSFDPPLSDDEADAEVAREYHNAVAGMEKGFAFLTSADHVALTAPAAEQPEAAGELLDTVKEATLEFGRERLREMSFDMVATFTRAVLPFFFAEEQAEVAEAIFAGTYREGQELVAQLLAGSSRFSADALTEDFEKGLVVGAVVLGATAVIATEAIQVAQDYQVLPTLQANRTRAYAAPDLDELAKSSEGRQKLVNAFVNRLMPDYTLRRHEEPAPAGAPPAPSSEDPVFHVRALFGTTTIESNAILAEDWARPGILQAISVTNGWVRRAPLLGNSADDVALTPGAPTPNDDLLGDAWSDTSFNYVDPDGSWWQAWPVRGHLLQVRYASPLVGSVSIYRDFHEGVPNPDGIACHDASFGIDEITAKDTGYRCVYGPSVSFWGPGGKDDPIVKDGDFIQIGDQVKKVEHVLDDHTLETVTPFHSVPTSPDPISTNVKVMRLVPSDPNCWTDGNCKLGDTIEYRSRAGGLYTASIGDRPPVIAPSIVGALHPITATHAQACDPAGVCSSQSVPEWTFAPGEALTLDTHAFDPDPGDAVHLVNWQFCDPTNLCDFIANIGERERYTFTKTFDKPGTWTVRIFAEDRFGKSTAVNTRITLRKIDQHIAHFFAGGGTYGGSKTLAPSSDSGLPVEINTETPDVCTTSGDHGWTISFIASGKCVLSQTQAGNVTYNPADGPELVIVVSTAPATVHVTPVAAQYSDPLPNLNALGSVTGLIGSDTLTGTLSGCAAADVTTAAGGITSAPGDYALSGCGGLSSPNYRVGYSGSLTVTPESATLTPTTPWYVATASATSTAASVPLSVSVSQASDGHPGDITKARVNFLVWKSSNLTMTPDYVVSNVAVGAGGTASATLTLPPDVYRYVARLNPSAYFNGLPVMDAFAVFRPTAGTRASGGGWVSDPAAGGNHKAQFAFNVTNGSSGIASGGATFSWLNPTDGYLYAASCSDWSAGGLLASGNAATMTCRGSLGALNPATGMPVAGLGGSGYSMVLKATDNGGGKSDTLSVTIKTPAGAVAHNLASAGGGQVTIGGGNIMVQQK